MFETMSASVPVKELTALPRREAIRRLDRRARETFTKLSPQIPGVDQAEVLRRSARFLEQWRAIVGFAEAIERTHAVTYGDVTSRAPEIVRIAELVTRIDPVAALLSDPALVSAARRDSKLEERVDEPFPLKPDA